MTQKKRERRDTERGWEREENYAGQHEDVTGTDYFSEDKKCCDGMLEAETNHREMGKMGGNGGSGRGRV